MKILIHHELYPVRGYGGVNYLEDAMKDLGHEVHAFNYKKYSSNIPILYQIVTRRMNLELKKQIVQFKPDIFFAVIGKRIFPETVEFMKKKGIKTIIWCESDIAFFEKISQYVAKHYDYVFTSSVQCAPRYKKLGVKNVEYIPFMFFEKLGELKITKDDIEKYGCEISFAGNFYPLREKILEALTDYDLQIYGPQWQHASQKMRIFFRGLCHEVYKLYKCSDICLNIHQDEQVYGGMKANSRCFEVTGIGRFLLTDRIIGIEDLFDIGKEIVCYDNIKDLKEKVQYYLDNPKERMKIAKMGQRRTLKNYTYRILLNRMLNS